MTPPVVPVMKKLQDSMAGLLLRSDLGDDEKAKHYMQLQNKYNLTFKQQLNSRLKDSNPLYSEDQRQISSNLMLKLMLSHVKDLRNDVARPAASLTRTTAVHKSDPSLIYSGHLR